MSLLCRQRLARLLVIVRERQSWMQELTQVKRMRQWVLDAEEILSGHWGWAAEVVSNETVGKRLDAWRQMLTALANCSGPFRPLACFASKRVQQNERPALGAVRAQ